MASKKSRPPAPPPAPPVPLRVATLQAFGAAIRKQRERFGLTLDAVAAKTGISKPYLSNIETARAPGPPSEEKLRLLAGALQLDPHELLEAADWLRTPASVRRALEAFEKGRDTPNLRRADGTLDLDALLPAHKPSPSPGDAYAPIPLREVPIINKVPAGAAGEFGDMNYPAGVADDYVPVPDLPAASVKAAFALRVAGDSMVPDYQPGELIIVAPGHPADGDDAVVRLGPGENFATTFKRIFFVRDGDEPRSLRLVPLNSHYPARTVPIEEVTGIYPLLYRLLPAKPREGGSSSVPTPHTPAPREFTSRVSIEHD